MQGVIAAWQQTFQSILDHPPIQSEKEARDPLEPLFSGETRFLLDFRSPVSLS